MKSVAVLAAAVAILAAGTFSAVATSHAQRTVVGAHAGFALYLPSGHAGFGRLTMHRVYLPADNPTATPAATDTPTATAATTATATPTATAAPQFPDPQTLLQTMAQVLDVINTVHFDELALQTGPVNLNIHAVGDATCKGPAFKDHVNATATVPGTSQSQKHTYDLVVYKSKIEWKSKKSHSLWATAKATTVLNYSYGYAGENPLPCPAANSSGTGSGSGNDVLKDLTTVGADSISGNSVWHIHATDVSVDTSGNTTESPLDWYIGQTNKLLYRFVEEFDDTAHGIADTLTYNLTKYGEHVKVALPKIGSK